MPTLHRRYPSDALTVLDALTYAGNRDSIRALIESGAVHFVHGDIRDQTLVERLLRDRGVDIVVHFAAESHVDRSISGPDAFIETNVVGTHSLLKAARQVWLVERRALASHRFHHISTDEVFGSLAPGDPPFTEQNQYQPNSPYSASKAAADHLVRAYHHTYGLNTTTSNCSNNYGPYHFPEKLIPLCITNLLRGKLLPVYGDGANIRDWLHVEDHCRGIDLAIRKGRAGETYNLGGCNEWDNLALVRLLCREMDGLFAGDRELADRFPECPASRGMPCEASIHFVTDRPGHDRRYAINAGRAMAELGYRPEMAFTDGLRQTILWYLANETWWQPLLDRR